MAASLTRSVAARVKIASGERRIGPPVNTLNTAAKGRRRALGSQTGADTQPHVIRRPVAGLVAERRRKQRLELAQDRLALGGGHGAEIGPAEGGEPAAHAGGERRRPRREQDALHRKAVARQERPVLLGR